MKKFTLTAITLAALALPLAASATTLFTFDPTGTAGSAGDITSLATLDQAVGNALSVGGSSSTVGTSTRLLYQANLDTVKDANGTIKYTNGSTGQYFTFVAGFSEIVTSNANGTVKFALDASQPTFFKMYATSTPGSNLSGAGFAGGTLLLSGTIGATGFTSNFSADTDASGNPMIEDFDQAGPKNDYPGIKTITGAGATKINTNINYVNSLYFPTFNATSLIMSFVNTSQVLPYLQVDPSAAFSSDGVTSANKKANIGAINGISGPDFQFQADANSSFTVTSVPEPGSLALVGLALGGLGFVTRRRNVDKS